MIAQLSDAYHWTPSQIGNEYVSDIFEMWLIKVLTDEKDEDKLVPINHIF
jgi:hypothetical protein